MRSAAEQRAQGQVSFLRVRLATPQAFAPAGLCPRARRLASVASVPVALGAAVAASARRGPLGAAAGVMASLSGGHT